MKLPYSKDEFLDRKHEFIDQCVKENISYGWTTFYQNNHISASYMIKKTRNTTLDYLYNQIFFDGHMKRFSFVCMSILSAPVPQEGHLEWFDSNAQVHINSKNYPSMVERATGYEFKIRFYENKFVRSYLLHPKFTIAHRRNFPHNLAISSSHYESINVVMSYFYTFDRDFLI